MSIPVNMVLMRRVSLFSVLNDTELELLQRVAVRKDYPRNQVVINEKEDSNGLYIILSGRVKVQKSSMEGKEVILSVLGPGEVFGEMSLIDDEPRSATVITIEPSQFISLGKQDFRRCLEESPDMSMMIMRGLVKRLREADRRIESLALLDVFGRVARILLEHSEEENGQHVINNKITRQDIAKMVGASREMVSRVMKTLEETGYIIVREDGKTVVLDKLPDAF